MPTKQEHISDNKRTLISKNQRPFLARGYNFKKKQWLWGANET